VEALVELQELLGNGMAEVAIQLKDKASFLLG
jgi:hypothetical protein